MAGSSVISALHHLRMSKEYLNDFLREHPGSRADRLFNDYIRRMNWIADSFITHPFLPEMVREGMKKEWNSDVFQITEIGQKIAALNPEQRELVETIIENLLKGEEIQFVNEQ